MELSVTTLRFVLSPTEKILLPEHPGSALRGGLGQGLYNIACSFKDRDCEDCSIKFKCPYSVLFNPFLTEREKEETSKRFHNKPRPFVIEAEKRSGKYNTGDELTFIINLFGYSQKLLPYVIESWRYIEDIGLGSTRGTFKLKEVWLDNDIAGKSKRIYASYEDTVKNVEIKVTGNDINDYINIFDENRIKINYISPILMKYKGSFVNDVTFDILMRNLFRRLTSLSHFYGDERLDIDFGSYLERAEKQVTVKKDNTEWERWYRYSNRQNKRIEMQGLVGEIVFVGELAEFLRYLVWGQYIHVGKNTVFGQGEYEVVKN